MKQQRYYYQVAKSVSVNTLKEARTWLKLQDHYNNRAGQFTDNAGRRYIIRHSIATGQADRVYLNGEYRVYTPDDKTIK